MIPFISSGPMSIVHTLFHAFVAVFFLFFFSLYYYYHYYEPSLVVLFVISFEYLRAILQCRISHFGSISCTQRDFHIERIYIDINGNINAKTKKMNKNNNEKKHIEKWATVSDSMNALICQCVRHH